jgi:hypothetical protein
MSESGISRRKVMAVGAAAVAGASVVGRGAGAAAAGASTPNAVAGAAQSSQPAMRLETLPALASGEQSYITPGIAMIGSGLITYVSNPYAGEYSTNWIGIGINVPLGALITGVDFLLYGNPVAGTVNIDKYLPDGAGYVSAFGPVPVNGTGAQVFSVPIGETFDGSQAYHAFHSSGSGTNVLRAIRVRYIPRDTGFVPVTPTRVYDSRLSMVPDANGAIASGANRTLSIVNGRDAGTGVVNSPNIVPANAAAIAYTLTIANTVASGFLAVNPGGNATVSASTINWSQSGALLANTGVVKIAANGTVTVICGGGGSTDFLIDVVGYFTS